MAIAAVKFDGTVPKTLEKFALANTDKIYEVCGKGVLQDDA